MLLTLAAKGGGLRIDVGVGEKHLALMRPDITVSVEMAVGTQKQPLVRDAADILPWQKWPARIGAILQPAPAP